MKLKKLGSGREVNVPIAKYIIKGLKLKNPSKPEQTVWNFLYPYWKNHVVLNQLLVPGSLLRLDLFNVTLGVCIEISPESIHGRFNPFMHGSREGYKGVIKRDLEKQDWIEKNGFKYVVLVDEDINNLSKKLFKEKFDIQLQKPANNRPNQCNSIKQFMAKFKTKEEKVEYIKSLKGKISDRDLRRKVREVFGIGKSQGNDLFNKIFNPYGAGFAKKLENNIRETVKAELNTNNRAGTTVRKNGDTTVVEVKDVDSVKTLDELIEYCQIDITQWKAKKFTSNIWDGKLQVKAEFERKIDTKAIEELFANFIEKTKEHAPRFLEVPELDTTGGDDLYILNIQDAHIGKLAYGKETGWSDYDLKIAKDYFRNAVNELIKKAPIQNIKKVLIIVGSDLIHFDTEGGETTKRTKLDSADSRWSKVYNETCTLVTELIEEVASMFDVEVMVVTGNHAKLTEYCLGSYIKAWFRNHPNVNVNNEPMPRKYFGYGNNLIMFTHGDDMKLNDLPMVMFREKQGEISKYKHLYILTGHLHQDKTSEFHGVKVFISPALCPPDSWHSNKNYVGNIQTSQGMVFSKQSGLSSIIYSTPV